MPKTILVTGATGTVGSDVLRGLRGRADVHLRAAVRDKEKSAALAGPNVELAWFDYTMPETLGTASRGADAVFMVPPFSPDGVAESLEFLQAARESGVKHVVKLSVIHSLSGMTVGKWHGAIDEALKKSGMAWTILLPGGFMQNFVNGSAPRPDGNMYLPVGNAKVAYVDTRDIAAVAVKALTEPGHEGKEYTLTGPEDLSYSEMAAIITEASGRQIRHVDVPPEAARQGMMSAHMPEWMVEIILEINAWAKASQGGEITTTVKDVLGRPAHTFREFARDYADRWKA
jgi:uncharacterized protein YbjT (DUF2867 family)